MNRTALKLGKCCFQLIVLCFTLLSCSGGDYVDAIPAESIALVAVNMGEMNGGDEGENDFSPLSQLLRVNDLSQCGLDGAHPLYLFETSDGMLGLCAKVKSKKDLSRFVDNSLVKNHLCQKVTERHGHAFTLVNNSWLMGFSDKALLVMGPVVSTSQAVLQQQMVRLLDSDSETGIKNRPIFDRLSQLDSPVAMVAQAKALPEKLVAPLMLGAPKEADDSQVWLAVEAQPAKAGLLELNGEAFSFNSQTDKALKDAAKTFRPISGKYIETFHGDAACGLFANVEGGAFLKMLQGSKPLQALLVGVNTSIDFDNIVRSIDGDLLIQLPSLTRPSVQLNAQLSNTNFLDDLAYWKQSCPKGTSITDVGENIWCLNSGDSRFYFGVRTGNQFFLEESGSECSTTTPDSLKATLKDIEGEHLCFVVNLSSLLRAINQDSTLQSVLRPLLGEVNTLVYKLKK